MQSYLSDVVMCVAVAAYFVIRIHIRSWLSNDTKTDDFEIRILCQKASSATYVGCFLADSVDTSLASAYSCATAALFS